MNFEDLINKAVYKEPKTKSASDFQKSDMGDPAKLYAYIKSRVDEGLNEKGKHQFITEYNGEAGITMKAFNSPLYFNVVDTGDTITVKKFEGGKVSDWETRPVVQPNSFLPAGSVEKALEILQNLTSANEFEELPTNQQEFWTQRAESLNKILNHEQPMVEAYARHLWLSDSKALEIHPEWIENVRDVKLAEGEAKKVSSIKQRLKNQASRTLNYDKDTL